MCCVKRHYIELGSFQSNSLVNADEYAKKSRDKSLLTDTGACECVTEFTFPWMNHWTNSIWFWSALNQRYKYVYRIVHVIFDVSNFHRITDCVLALGAFIVLHLKCSRATLRTSYLITWLDLIKILVWVWWDVGIVWANYRIIVRWRWPLFTIMRQRAHSRRSRIVLIAVRMLSAGAAGRPVLRTQVRRAFENNESESETGAQRESRSEQRWAEMI